MQPKRRLSDIDVLFISLVDKGANMKKIVYKSEELPEDPPISKTVEILKTDDDKHMVFGIVYSPEETDSQGDITDATEIEKAAHGFMKYRRLNQIDKNHNQNAEEGFVVESWITREGDALFKEDAPEGSWAVGIKIENKDTWAEIKKGTISGLSLMGTSKIEQLEKSWISGLLEKIGVNKGKFGEMIRASKARRMMWDLTDAFNQGVNEIMSETFKGDKKEALSKMVDELQDYIEKEFPKELEKAGRKISSVNAKKLQDAISVLNTLLELAQNEKSEENKMTDEDKKEIADMISKKEEDLRKDLNTQFDKVITGLNDTIKKHEDAFAELAKSKGSQQNDGQETQNESEAAELAKQGKWKDKEGNVHNHIFA